MKFRLTAVILLCLLNLPLAAQTIGKEPVRERTNPYAPEIYGGVKTKWEASLYDGSSRFNVRNSRIGVRGFVDEYMRYAVQIDVNNQGSLSVLDSYIAMVMGNLELSLGQQQYGFSTDLDRGPTSNIFANRSFLSKYLTTYYGETLSGGAPRSYAGTIGSRDIGAIARYKFGELPLKLSLGLFNGSGANLPEWQNSMNVIGRIEVGREEGLWFAASHYNGRTPAKTGVVSVDGTPVEEEIDQKLAMWGGEARYVGDNYRIEGEYAQRRLQYHGTHVLSAAHVLGFYRFNMDNSNVLKYIAPVGRWDIGRNIEFIDTAGSLEKFSANRATIGVNFGFMTKMVSSEITLQYEKYFLDRKPSDFAENPLLQDKITIEFIAAF